MSARKMVIGDKVELRNQKTIYFLVDFLDVFFLLEDDAFLVRCFGFLLPLEESLAFAAAAAFRRVCGLEEEGVVEAVVRKKE